MTGIALRHKEETVSWQVPLAYDAAAAAAASKAASSAEVMSC